MRVWGCDVSIDSTRRALRGKGRVVFPIASIVLTALIVASPFFTGLLAFLHEKAFARFCLFWCLGVCIVLATSARPLRPSVVASISTAISIVVAVTLYFVYDHVIGMPTGIAAFFFSCLSGAILGALAGTWIIYVLIYAGGNRR